MARNLERSSAEEIVRWATETFGDRFAVTASMSDGVLSHVAGRAAPGVTVLFLDTGYHFPETIGTRDAVAATYPVEVKTVTHPLRVRARGRIRPSVRDRSRPLLRHSQDLAA